MIDDFVASLRSLRSSRGFTISALIVLTLGIGATTAIFSVVDAVVLRGLPFDEHDRLVAVGQRSSAPERQSGGRDPEAIMLVAPQNYLDWRPGSAFRVDRRDWQRLAHAARARARTRVAGAAACSAGFSRSCAPRRRWGGPSRWKTKCRAAIAWPSSATDVAAPVRRQSRDHRPGDPARGSRRRAVGERQRRLRGDRDHAPRFTYPVGAARHRHLDSVLSGQSAVRDPRKYVSYLQVIARLRSGVSQPQAQSRCSRWRPRSAANPV